MNCWQLIPNDLLNLLIGLTLFPLSGTQQDLVTISIPEVTVTPGKSSLIRIAVQVKEGYHLQGNKLDNDALIPTTLTIDLPEGLHAGPAVFPPAKKFKLEGTKDSLEVFDGTFEIRMILEATAAQKGKYNLPARLRYQACDSRTCFFPKTKEFFIPVHTTDQRDGRARRG